MANVLFKLLTRAQYDALDTVDAGTLYRVTESDNSESFYQGTNKLDRNDLDVTEFALGSKNAETNVITLKGLKEVDGKVAAGTTSGNDIVFAAVAATGDSADVGYSNTTSGLTATNVQDAIDEVAAASAGGVDSKTIYITSTAGESADTFSRRYSVYQGANAPDATTNPASLISNIDIPKDMVCSAGIVVDITYDNGKLYDGLTDVTTTIMGSTTPTSADAGKYIRLTIANSASDKIYIKATDLVDVYTAEQNASQVQLSINNNEISAAIVAGSITSTELASDAVTTVKIADDAVTADKIAISAHSETQTAGTDGLAISVTTTDGQVSAVSGSIAAETYDDYGAADAAVAALGVAEFALGSVASNVLTLKGIKEVDGKIAAGTDSTKEITLEEVAMTGAAGDVSVADAGNFTSQTTVEGALQEIYGNLQWQTV